MISSLFSSTQTSHKTIYDFSIRQLDSEQIIDFSDFSGHKILIVNVASKCGFTYQYEELEALYQQYKDRLVVIGMPCNQFLGQEPGSEEKISHFCSLNYGVTFPMTEKVKVKGRNAHPIYQWLTKKEQNGSFSKKVSWNFNKFLLDEKGKLIAHFGAKTRPLDTDITSYLD